MGEGGGGEHHKASKNERLYFRHVHSVVPVKLFCPIAESIDFAGKNIFWGTADPAMWGNESVKTCFPCLFE